MTSIPYARKIILHAPPWDSPLLDDFVKACLRDRVSLVCVIGEDCERVHDVIDELVVGDGSSDRPEGPITTTWHTNETLTEVRAFAEAWRIEGDEYTKVQEVTLNAVRSHP
jgi:hypothetical protein